jgi:hypothetical protein
MGGVVAGDGCFVMNERVRADGSALTGRIAEEDHFVQVRREDRRVRARRRARGRFAHSDWRLEGSAASRCTRCFNEGRPKPTAQ